MFFIIFFIRVLEIWMILLIFRNVLLLWVLFIILVRFFIKFLFGYILLGNMIVVWLSGWIFLYLFWLNFFICCWKVMNGCCYWFMFRNMIGCFVFFCLGLIFFCFMISLLNGVMWIIWLGFFLVIIVVWWGCMRICI